MLNPFDQLRMVVCVSA